MQINDPHFEKVYNKKLLKKLRDRFGPFHQHHAELAISSQWMLNLMNKMDQKSRRGEVVMVIPNKEGNIWLHTKDFYGNGVYRLMTGGLDPGEEPDLAFEREVREETGFKVNIDRCLAVITYTFTAGEKSQSFVSYVFTAKRTQGLPQPVDSGEAIAGFKAVPVSALGEVAQNLSSLKGARADWGIFRAVAHTVVQEQLQAQARAGENE